ncbi:DNA integrity scanning protein DisA nucleotide-binding domain protein [Tuwongella immobilis]|uniref:DAC domain-containing protein n=1 Tax=Tuwongella immobilis TaxID=692036 RepID=A0A6C2YTE3_9BACT|nr:diadenylate cyclase [Tuwongella immobilis]VIP04651.1 Uncharacterized protein OS=Blastopirellula marina DSM 3645 GN=DSM3645_23026 PE=4 SV=1: DisA_N [Tuwongella immobilis]VTS06663.1 Uncharacterized protein OS=Blastopirellula marina DSM 3645 GN=DSM3645_23026 PE=4 SV=1: DisA_N [Tuwongella immobilis]
MALPPQTLGLLQAARCLNTHVMADAVVLLTETQLEWSEVIAEMGDTRLIVAADHAKLAPRLREEGTLTVINLPIDSRSIQERLGQALLEATCSGKLKEMGRVVVIYNGVLNDPNAPEPLDSLSVIHLNDHLEKMKLSDLRRLKSTVPVETLRRVIDLAAQIGREGREGQPVGALFVVGDTENVLPLCRPINFNPFRGYKTLDRSLVQVKVREQIKELAKLDGAFIITNKGIAKEGCVYLDVPSKDVELPAGFGSRHWAAASVSKMTKAVAICVSQSSGSVRVFVGGKQQMYVAATPSRPHLWSNVRLDTHVSRPTTGLMPQPVSGPFHTPVKLNLPIPHSADAKDSVSKNGDA